MKPKHLFGNVYHFQRNYFAEPAIYWKHHKIIPLPALPSLIEFPEQTVIIAKDQPQYRPLPAYQHGDKSGTITFCWKLSLIDRLKLLFTGKLWHNVLTFNYSLQPQLLMVDKPFMLQNPQAAVVNKN